MSDCPLCEAGIPPEEVIATISEEFDAPEAGEHFDIVGAKRLLESEYDVELTVVQTKRHLGRAATRVHPPVGEWE